MQRDEESYEEDDYGDDYDDYDDYGEDYEDYDDEYDRGSGEDDDTEDGEDYGNYYEYDYENRSDFLPNTIHLLFNIVIRLMFSASIKQSFTTTPF